MSTVGTPQAEFTWPGLINILAEKIEQEFFMEDLEEQLPAGVVEDKSYPLLLKGVWVGVRKRRDARTPLRRFVFEASLALLF